MVNSDLIVRILCDTEPGAVVDGAYLFAQSSDNQDSVLKTGVELLSKRQVRRLLLQDSGPGFGFPGYKSWHDQLTSSGINSADICGVPTIPSEIFHTAVEADALVQFARENAYAAIIIIASPFHQLRAFINTVTFTIRCYPELRVYSRAGANLPWNETATHSQGTLRKSRYELIRSEFERIERYRLKGDLATDDEIETYLNWRDSIVPAAHQ